MKIIFFVLIILILLIFFIDSKENFSNLNLKNLKNYKAIEPKININMNILNKNTNEYSRNTNEYSRKSFLNNLYTKNKINEYHKPFNFINVKYDKFKLPSHSEINYTSSFSTFSELDILDIINNIDLYITNLKYKEAHALEISIWNDRKRKYTYNYNEFIKAAKYVENKIIKLMKKKISNNLKNYLCSKLKNCIPKIINRNLIKIELHGKKLHSKNLKYSFLFEIYIKKKLHSHIFYSEIEVINNKYYINLIKLVGNNYSDKINLLPGFQHKKTYDKKYVNIKNNIELNKYNGGNDYIRSSSYKKIIDEKQIRTTLNKKEFINLRNLKQYKCFGKPSLTRNECESKIDSFGNKVIKGIWDKKCQKNSECPFYKKNKNYPNNRGGCINGYCELPIGYIQKGYRYFEKKSIGLCYNCKSKNINCCDDQKKKSKYNNFKSPDYAFENDFMERYKYNDYLNKNKMDIY